MYKIPATLAAVTLLLTTSAFAQTSVPANSTAPVGASVGALPSSGVIVGTPTVTTNPSTPAVSNQSSVPMVNKAAPVVNSVNSVVPTNLHRGANSFTESETQHHLVKEGYNNVKTIGLDQQGIWHGTASKNSKNYQFEMDYKGNVRTQEVTAVQSNVPTVPVAPAVPVVPTKPVTK